MKYSIHPSIDGLFTITDDEVNQHL